MKKMFILIILFALIACTETSNIFESPSKKPTPPNESEFNPIKEDAYAFPGAEGGGMNATGGRGGKVYIVNSLEDSNKKGTFRHAIEQKEKRIIVFNVSGTIYLKSAISIKNGDLTIAGQTAPGDGICIANFPVSVSADNIIIRYMRFRMGDKISTGSDGDDALGGRQTDNVIIDHCSISWSTDECASFYDNTNFTMQWCIISESLRLSNHSKGPHGYGAIWGGVNASFHHNLMAHHDSRTPRFGPGAKNMGTDKVDLRNNVFYNWSGNGCYGGEAMQINIINNYYKPGPATDNKIKTNLIGYDVSPGGGVFDAIKGIWGKLYISGNTFNDNSLVSENNWLGVKINNRSAEEGYIQADRTLIELTSPLNLSPINTHTAELAYEKVLQYAGHSLHRDDIDERIIEETKTGTAQFKGLSKYNGYGNNYPESNIDWKSKNHPKFGLIDSQEDLKPLGAAHDWSAWPNLKQEEAPLDSDNDGMPDEWEISMNLNPQKNDANQRNLSTAYDNIEVYINSLVKDITDSQK